MSDDGNESPNHNRRSNVVNRETLIPLGIVAGGMFMIFQAAEAWTMSQVKQQEHERVISELRLEVRLLTDALDFYRRETERRIGPLPDYKPNTNSQNSLFDSSSGSKIVMLKSPTGSPLGDKQNE